MSSGAECFFIEREPGQWVYRLQRWPYGDSEDYDTFGPFASFGRARDHLDQNHQNPGGWVVKAHPTGHVHEWVTGEAHEPVGVEVKIKVVSLGPDPDRAAVIALIKALPDDHPAWGRPYAVYGYREATVCDSCNVVKP